MEAIKYLAIDTTGKYLKLFTHEAAFCDTRALSHSVSLMPKIAEMLGENRLKGMEYIAVNVGPGSFTGIRIGVATAKMLAYAADIPVIPINSLELNAYVMFNAGSRSIGNQVSDKGGDGNDLSSVIRHLSSDRICSVINGSNTYYYAEYGAGRPPKLRFGPAMLTSDEVRLRAVDMSAAGDTAGLKIAGIEMPDPGALYRMYIEDAVNEGRVCNPVDLEAFYIQPSQAEKQMTNDYMSLRGAR
ncbi:MAG: tRNA (adenosine(37)-N6)-threonylcarbamoyltransferase complex dimerization subunit type 1 TsaB [Firmicutes bacterium]|nr:tRNA (adenosine(37)-N6)-threonylcarbamoyltransferase complex dimerization subunit type 1 TsaB [Bacillota bacterium]